VHQHCQQIADSVWAVQVVGGMSRGVQPHLVLLPLRQGVGAAGQCHVVVLCCGLAVALGLCGMGVGVGGCWHLPCVDWALLVLWPSLVVWAGVGFLLLEVVGAAGPCCVPGQVVAAVVGCCPWCVVGCGAVHGILAIGVWVGVAIIVVG
jgi:hypothetical protein